MKNKIYKISVDEKRLEAFLNSIKECEKIQSLKTQVKLQIDNLVEKKLLLRNLEPNLLRGVADDQVYNIRKQLANLYKKREDLKNDLKEKQKYLDIEQIRIFSNKKLIKTINRTCFNKFFTENT